EDDPRHRTYCINTVLNLDDAFICRLDHLNVNVRDALRSWIGQDLSSSCAGGRRPPPNPRSTLHPVSQPVVRRTRRRRPEV
ncbi:MAG: hypothetical protein ACLQOO_03525, partial [Terriglobia bacterium]